MRTEEEAINKRRREHELERRGEGDLTAVFNEPDVLTRLGHGRLVFRRLFQLDRV